MKEVKIYRKPADVLSDVRKAAAVYNDAAAADSSKAADVAAARAALEMLVKEFNDAARHDAFITARLDATDTAPAMNILARRYTCDAVRVKFDARARYHADVNEHAAAVLNPLDALSDARAAAIAGTPAAQDVAAALDALADAVQAAAAAAIAGADDKTDAAALDVAGVKKAAAAVLGVMGFKRVKVKADAAAFIVLTSMRVKGADARAVVNTRRAVAAALMAAAHIILCGRSFDVTTPRAIKAARDAAEKAAAVKA